MKKMKKGFTLVELLAVIVILAVIALIAVPIILGIIDDSKKSANKSSEKLYLKAVDTALVAYKMKTGNSLTGTYKVSGDNLIDQDNNIVEGFVIDYEGNDIECSEVIIDKDGKVSISGCTINGESIETEVSVEQKLEMYYTILKKASVNLPDGKYKTVGYEVGVIMSTTSSSDTATFQYKDKIENKIECEAVYINQGKIFIPSCKVDDTLVEYSLGEIPNGIAVYYNPQTNQSCPSDPSTVNHQLYNNYKGVNPNEQQSPATNGCMKWYAFNGGESSKTVSLVLDHATHATVDNKLNSVNTALTELTNTYNWSTSINLRAFTKDEFAQIIGVSSLEYYNNYSNIPSWVMPDDNRPNYLLSEGLDTASLFTIKKTGDNTIQIATGGGAVVPVVTIDKVNAG